MFRDTIQISARHRKGLLSSILVWFTLCQSLMWGAYAHVAPWHKGMYCFDGNVPGVVDQDTNAAAQPLYMLNESDWWFHHANKCDEFPPAAGNFLELPANGEFTVELAINRAFTTLSYNGVNTALYGDGQDHPGLGVTSDGRSGESDCIINPNIHTQNESMAAGTAFAISYNSDITKVTKEDLVVFTVLYNTPWRRIATYSVPNLPACPEPDGCTCAWGWVADGCGEPNIYMLPFRCRVTGQTGDVAVGPAKPPVWCEDDKTKCVQGPKQMVFWNQLEGNNIEVSGFNLAGDPKSPTYNSKLGFTNGAQTDIFNSATSASLTDVPFASSTGNTSGSEVRGIL